MVGPHCFRTAIADADLNTGLRVSPGLASSIYHDVNAGSTIIRVNRFIKFPNRVIHQQIRSISRLMGYRLDLYQISRSYSQYRG